MDAKFDGLVSNSKERVGKDEKYLLSIGKIQKQCKWKPITLDEGLLDWKIGLEKL